jgi:hypothetical protein
MHRTVEEAKLEAKKRSYISTILAFLVSGSM